MSPITFRDLEMLSRMVYGEARGEGLEGKIAVAAVAVNRWRSGRWFAGPTLADTVLKPWQFSCFNENDPNRDELMAVGLDNRIFRDCVEAAIRAIAGQDPTGGACHYHADYLPPPSWARGRTPSRAIGRHLFFVGID